ncbi:hypothetical protein LXD69_09655 [Flavobacterium sediminilitoris]|uniref:LysM domain-containing protein n=1 Tax=Flavobacterium sediminilitoris TaxID=2024526 RepID=A0ABY4HJ75_9FLAO|nr:MULTISPECIES: hypothetical protein [Flavobacterium]UOX32317.1 hypothetical protein LXD69_09655 [Flavobacterium sediminilitoris]
MNTIKILEAINFRNMPNTQTPSVAVTKRYYPTLSTILNEEDIPEILGFIKEGLVGLLGKIHYKDLQYTKSPRGDAAFYSLNIVSPKRLAIELPGSGISLVLNPDVTGNDFSISSFPITVEYQWKVLGYLRSFNIDSFSFAPQELFEMALLVLNISEEQVLANFINLFVTPSDANITPLQQFVIDINAETTIVLSPPTNNTTLTEIVQEIYTQGGNQYASLTAFGVYLLDDDLNTTLSRVKLFFKSFIPDDLDAFIKDILIPKFRATLTLIAGVEFPRSLLQPVYDENGVNPYNPSDVASPNSTRGLSVIPADANGYPKVLFTFVEALFYADTEKGFGYNMELVLNTIVPAQIGNTGLIINIQNLKLDLSKENNIIEAEADGRPDDFMGFYSDKIDIYLPKKWFSKDNSIQQTVKLTGKRLLVGTGGISGIIGLEAVALGNPITENDYFWFIIGSETTGFKIGFSKFDITFKQNLVTSSNIAAALEIPKLKFPDDHPVSPGAPFKIDVLGHLDHEGDFNLTAAANGGIVHARIGDYVDFNFLSLELGKQDTNFYVGTSVEISFPSGLINELLGDQKIIIPRLRFYSNGKFEIVGGNGFLPVNINLPLGPVNVSVTGIHMGSIQREHQGILRSYNYIGFDGAISVDPFALDARGEGIKYYYTNDDDENGGNGHSFLHIQTIEIDLVVPAKTKAVSLHGLLSIPEPGASQEYVGEIDFKLKKGNITGRAAMKLAPKFPAFIVDAEIELPKPIPLGSFAIYGFRGLVGFRYVAEKKAIPALPPTATWYDYYKFPPKGIHVSKFSGPYQSEGYSNPFSFGAGAVLGTSFDSGTVLSMRAMVLLSIPSLFMIEARASLISSRLGLTDSKEPPFWAMVAWGDNTIEAGMGADFKMPTATGKVLTLNANVEALFPLNNSRHWYINIGTREKPNTATLFKDVVNLRALSYLMIASEGLEFGARMDYELKKNFFGIKVRLWAFVEIGAKISFERPQFGGYIHLGGGIEVNVWRVLYIGFSLNAYLSGEAVKPYLIYAQLRFSGRVRVLRFLKIRFNISLQLKWEKNREVDTSPIPVLSDGTAGTPNILNDLVKGVHMLTNEEFKIKYFNTEPTIALIEDVIPLDTFIDIKFSKGVVPNLVTSKIGGHTSGAENFVDLIPPQKTVRGGHVLRQVKHKYSIESIAIKCWNGTSWIDYHPVEALDPNVPSSSSKKIGYWQRSGNQYDMIRILGGDPFSYTEQGEPGWFIPEQYGITASNLFCANTSNVWHSSNVLNKNIGHIYPLTGQQNGHFINGAYFSAIGEFGADPYIPNSIQYNNLVVSDVQNSFGFAKSLVFNNLNGFMILLPEDAPKVNLKLNSYAGLVVINYYKTVIVPNSSFIGYELVETKTKTVQELETEVVFDNINNPILKIEIIPVTPQYDEILAIQEEIEALFTDTYESSDDYVNVTLPNDRTQYDYLIRQLDQLLETGCVQINCEDRDNLLCELYDSLIALGCFERVVTSSADLNMECYWNFVNLIKNMMGQFAYIHQLIRKDYYDPCSILLNSLQSAITNNYSENEILSIYSNLNNAVTVLLNFLLEEGKCKCKKQNCTTSFQQVSWKTVLEYEFEATIPNQAAQEAENQALIESVLNTVQPIWRPNTNYYISFKLKDEVNNDATTTSSKEYYYGFKTAGPLGHFHDADGVKYGNEYQNGTITNRKNKDAVVSLHGKLINPDKYSLTSLRKYLDYNKSYPNIDGNLILAKPIYYENNQCKITLNFVKPLAFHMFKNWSSYKGLTEIKGALNIQIKDPVTELLLNYPLAITETTTEVVPQTTTSEGQPEWVGNNDPRLPLNIQILQNLIENGSIPCNFEVGQPLVPKSYSYSVEVTDLKPQKLYTAIINNAFDVNGDGNFTDYLNTTRNIGVSENKEVHKFVFQTSRYGNFKEHIESYILHEEEGNVVKAIYKLEHDFSQQMLNEAYAIVSNLNVDINTSILGYTDLFDRVIEGVFKLKPLDPAQTTEFNILKDLNGATVGLLIRSTESFNSPNFEASFLEDTISILNNNSIDYSILYAKDYASCLIMKNGIFIDETTLDIKFKYLGWSGTQLMELAVETISIDL